jgi:hypothetical protein
MTTPDNTRLLRALATLQSGRLTSASEGPDVVVFAEEWARAFSPEVLALLEEHYQSSQLNRPANAPSAT